MSFRSGIAGANGRALFDDETDTLSPGDRAQHEQRAFGVNRGQLHPVVRISQRLANRSYGLGIVRVPQNLNGADAGRGVSVLETRRNLVEGVLLRGERVGSSESAKRQERRRTAEAGP